jgi:hypothetical protein
MWLDYEIEITAAPNLRDLAEEAMEELEWRQPPV